MGEGFCAVGATPGSDLHLHVSAGILHSFYPRGLKGDVCSGCSPVISLLRQRQGHCPLLSSGLPISTRCGRVTNWLLLLRPHTHLPPQQLSYFCLEALGPLFFFQPFLPQTPPQEQNCFLSTWHSSLLSLFLLLLLSLPPLLSFNLPLLIWNTKPLHHSVYTAKPIA